VLLAEYITSGGTRTYVQDLLGYLVERYPRVSMVTTWLGSDPAMEHLAEELGVVL
jgi:hypothetical protein